MKLQIFSVYESKGIPSPILPAGDRHGYQGIPKLRKR